VIAFSGKHKNQARLTVVNKEAGGTLADQSHLFNFIPRNCPVMKQQKSRHPMHRFPLPLVLRRLEIDPRFFREGKKNSFILFFAPCCSKNFILAIGSYSPIKSFFEDLRLTTSGYFVKINLIRVSHSSQFAITHDHGLT
jgi:hypothetical protein